MTGPVPSPAQHARPLPANPPEGSRRSRSRWPVRWFRSPRAWLRWLTDLNGTPHEIALGAAIGMFIGLTPTVGLQFVLIGLLAVATRRWFRFSVPASVLFIYFSNPLTIVPLFWLNYRAGLLLVDGGLHANHLTALLHANSLPKWWAAATTVWNAGGLPLAVGSVMVGLPCAAVTYPAVRWLLRRLRPPAD